MILAEQQKLIESYCSKAGSYYYDVEQELVDHMLEWTENELQNPAISFEDAFKKMKEVFPLVECRKIVRSRSQSIIKRLWRESIQTLLSYFSWPKITVCFLLVALVIVIDKNTDISKFPMLAVHLLNLTALLFFRRGNIIYYNRVEKRRNLLAIRKVMHFQFYFMSPAIGYLMISMLSLFEYQVPAIFYTVALYAFPLMVLLLLASRATIIAAHEKIRENYPDAFA